MAEADRNHALALAAFDFEMAVIVQPKQKMICAPLPIVERAKAYHDLVFGQHGYQAQNSHHPIPASWPANQAQAQWQAGLGNSAQNYRGDLSQYVAQNAGYNAAMNAMSAAVPASLIRQQSPGKSVADRLDRLFGIFGI